MQELEQIVIKKPSAGPLVLVVLAFAAGIAAARTGYCPELLYWTGILCLSVIILTIHRHSKQKTISLLLLPLFFLIGAIYTQPHLLPPTTQAHIHNLINQRQKATLIGTLKQIPKAGSHKTGLIMEVEQVQPASAKGFTTATGLVQLTMDGKPSDALIPGHRFMARATVSRPHTFKTPGTFNYQNYLATQGIWLTGWVRSPAEISQLHEPQHASLRGLRYLPEKIRHHINRFLNSNIAESTTRGFYKAILTGDRSELSNKTLENFKTAGCFHLLAISGMHVGLLSLLIMISIGWLLKRSSWIILHFPVWKITALISFLPLTFYALITGFQPPVVRALVMITVFIAAILLNRQWSLLTNIAIAALSILLWRPTSLYSVSFQLSFAAATAIALLYPQLHPLLIKKTVSQKSRFPAGLQQWILTSFIVSLIAMLGTTPLLLFYFNRISLLSPISTLLVAPLLCFWALPLGLIALIPAPIFPELAAHLLSIGSWGLQGIDMLTSFLAELPHTNIWSSTPSIVELLCYPLLIIGLAAWKHHRTAKFLTLLALALLVIVPSAMAITKHLSRQVRVNFLDIGQGSSTLLELPRGYTILIDGGGPKTETFNVGDRIIAPFLWKNRISRLDSLVINHPHADHYNGLPFIIKRFKPKTIWINGADSREAEYDKLILLARQLGLAVKIADNNGPIFRDDKIRLASIGDFHLHPAHPANSGRPDSGSHINNQSLVLRLDCGKFSFLFPGDIEKVSERKLVADERDIDVDVLLAPHHGSQTSGSPEFMKTVSPEYLVISAGPFRPTIFPDQNQVTLWRQGGIKVFNTAQNGTITFVVDGDTLIVSPYVSLPETL